MWRQYLRVTYSDSFGTVHFKVFAVGSHLSTSKIQASSVVCRRISAAFPASRYKCKSLLLLRVSLVCTIFALFKFVLFVFVLVLPH